MGDDPATVLPRPDAFLWRGRLYLVREVYTTWLEREAWWESAVVPGRPAGHERRVWRVEAGQGRRAGTGVYDLAQLLRAPVLAPVGATGDGGPVRTDPAESGWRLLCHLD